MLRLAEAAEPELVGPAQMLWRNRLVAEQANVRSSLAWSLQNGHFETELRIAGALVLYWETQGLLAEGKEWLAQGLKTDQSTISTQLRAKALNAQALLTFRQGSASEAKELAEQALALAETLNDDVAAARALRTLGFVAIRVGDSGKALILNEQSLARYRRVGNSQGVAAGLNNLAMSYSFRREYDRAKPLFAESIQMARADKDRHGASRMTLFWATCAYMNGEYEEAAQKLGEALPLVREAGDMYSLAISLQVAAAVIESHGDLLGASRLLGASAAQTATLSINARGWLPYEMVLARIQAGLDTDTFEKAFGEGRAMALDEAAAYALERLAKLE